MAISTADLEAATRAEAHHARLCRLAAAGGAELRALLGADPAAAAPWIESAAVGGLVEAMLTLGQMRLDGLGVARDESAAFAWFARAARKGSPEGMNMVGRCHENGWGVPVDLIQAAVAYRSAAEAGHAWGQYNYAHQCFDGRGVAQDLDEALLWYLRAAGQGHARAMNLAGRCYEEGWGTPRDLGQALAWYRRAAEGGCFRARYNLATILAGQGRTEAAATWFAAAAADAIPDTRAVMAAALSARPEPLLSSLGRRLLDAAPSEVATA